MGWVTARFPWLLASKQGARRPVEAVAAAHPRYPVRLLAPCPPGAVEESLVWLAWPEEGNKMPCGCAAVLLVERALRRCSGTCA